MPKKRSPPPVTPGNFQVVLDLLKTCEGEARRESLHNLAAFNDWLAGREVLDVGVTVDANGWQEALVIRDGLQALIAARCGLSADRDAVDRLHEALGETVYRVRFEPNGRGYGRQIVGSGWTLVRSRLVDLVTTAMDGKAWSRLKVCPGCRCHFFDRAPGNNATWCPSKRCLSRKTSAAHRERKRQRLR